MSERVFLEDNEVRVTQARFMVPDQTYAMSNVTSVRSFRTAPARKAPVTLIVIGVFLLFTRNVTAVVIGIALVAIGALILYRQKPTYWVALATAAGERRAYSSSDAAKIDRIVRAINDAIVHRG